MRKTKQLFNNQIALPANVNIDHYEALYKNASYIVIGGMVYAIILIGFFITLTVLLSN